MSVNSIFDVFGKSPIKPLQKHIDKVSESANELTPFVDAVLAQDWAKAQKHQEKISFIEGEADKLKREIRLSLPSGIFMPVQRTDILGLITQQDKIANKLKDVAGLMIGRQQTIPAEMHDNFRQYVKRCVDAVDLTVEMINELDSLLETGFRGREVQLVVEMIQKIDRIEGDTDVMQVVLRRQLFELEKDLNPVDVIFMYKTLEWIGGVADQAERVGSRLELMLSKA
ncbi:TIGR00153 family protein [Vibrio sp. SS-MA-C1-2]|uniref:TIGR00153 family protein n=1 Tax=Vibrio sp. SS-MA-C1-2 TaxID=2908646 RepID=UPI001F361F95|nr:TIGR00153 family protein [Vibrio sp. SS-MA-C1-2]UJF16891.1 TIGR00153 family protein [Vibrio sp. SS-MA-C1-2]